MHKITQPQAKEYVLYVGKVQIGLQNEAFLQFRVGFMTTFSKIERLRQCKPLHIVELVLGVSKNMLFKKLLQQKTSFIKVTFHGGNNTAIKLW